MATNTLINRINTIQSHGELYKNANILRDKKKEIESFLVSYEELYKKSKDIKFSYDNLSKICTDLSIDVSFIRNNLMSLQLKVEKNEFDKGAVAFLKREIDKVNNELLKSWNQYILVKTSSIDGVISSLGNLIYENGEKDKLEIQKNIFLSSMIGSPRAVKAIDEYIEVYNVLMEKLDLSDTILLFLKLLTAGKPVTLNDMSLEVYNWIKASGFAGKINIEISSRK